MPATMLERRGAGAPSDRSTGTRRASSSNSTRSSSRARLAPRQKCGPPPPNATCSLGWRSMSKRNGSSNTSSSRLAETYQRLTLSPAFSAWPRSSVSRGDVAPQVHDRRGPAQDLFGRARGPGPRGPARACRTPAGCPGRRWRPWAAALRVVSLPAEERNRKNALSSRSVSLSPVELGLKQLAHDVVAGLAPSLLGRAPAT